jgi:hypothetical protein
MIGQSRYLVENNNVNGGTQRVYKFPNGYGASVIRHQGSYGFKSGLWELAVLDSSGHLCYSTPITNDVIGYLTDEEVILKLNEIRGLQTS